MVLIDADTDRPQFLGLGCRVVGNQVVCSGLALNEDVSGLTLEAILGDSKLTVKFPQIPRTDNLYNRFVEEIHLEIKAVSR